VIASRSVGRGMRRMPVGNPITGDLAGRRAEFRRI